MLLTRSMCDLVTVLWYEELLATSVDFLHRGRVAFTTSSDVAVSSKSALFHQVEDLNHRIYIMTWNFVIILSEAMPDSIVTIRLLHSACYKGTVSIQFFRRPQHISFSMLSTRPALKIRDAPEDLETRPVGKGYHSACLIGDV